MIQLQKALSSIIQKLPAMPRRTVNRIFTILWVGVILYDFNLIFQHASRSMSGDEWRYLYYAENLLNGLYSPADRIFLWNGPGYPLLLVPFVQFDWLIAAHYLNGILHWLALGYAWLTLRYFLSPGKALTAWLPLALYGPIYKFLPLLYTEALSFFLVTAWIYHCVRATSSWPHRIAASVWLGWLCLTKVIFGWAIGVLWLILLIWWISRRPLHLRPHLVQGALALGLCLPYLSYTYQLTGHVFYWSNAGPNSFYWLSSPYPDEWGDWYHQGWVFDHPRLNQHHGDIFRQATGLDRNPNLSTHAQVLNLSSYQASRIFRDQALDNIQSHPLRFLRNWLANIVRLFFDIPRTLRDIPAINPYSVWHGALLIATCVICYMRPSYKHFKETPHITIPLLGLLVFGGYSLTSGMGRFLIPLVPIWWLSLWLVSQPKKARKPLPES